MTCGCGFPDTLNTEKSTYRPFMYYHTWYVDGLEWGYSCLVAV
jgi:hypothetical protein